MNRLSRYPFFVFLLCLFFVMHGYREHQASINLSAASELLLIYLLAASILLMVFRLVYRNWMKAGLATFVILAIQFFFGATHDFLKTIFPNSFLSKYSFILPAILLTIGLILFFLRKTKRSFFKITSYLNILFIVLIAVEVFLISAFALNRSSETEPLLTDGFMQCDTCEKPDIYVIIADEYAGKESLKELFAFDNSGFLSELQNRGFQNLQATSSNYNFTPYSIASTLNMDYLHVGFENKKKLLHYTYEVTRNNNLLKFLRAHQYEFYNYSLIDYPEYPAHTDDTFLPVQTKLITGQTFLSRINKDLRFNLVSKFKSEKEQKRVVYTPLENNRKLIDLTARQASNKSERPKFTLTHLMMPHYPYYFDRNGKPFPYNQLTEGNQHNTNNYVEYLQYCNGQLLKLIDEIKKNSSRSPMIVLLGDHGFRHLTDGVDSRYFFNNQVSIHSPSTNKMLAQDSITNVNLFRYILNSSFRQQLPYLPDSTFIMENP